MCEYFCEYIYVHGYDWSINPILLKIDIHVHVTMTHVSNNRFFQNYYCDALSSITSKVFEHIILLRLEEYLWTTDNQFGFKAGHSTDLCIYALSELIEYFKSRSTSVYVAFLDASEAFDKISHWTLFRKLIDRNFQCI